MKLYLFPPSPRALKVASVADHLGLEYEARIVDLFNGGQHAPEYAALNPNRRMPVLEEDGFVLWESNAIMVYLGSKKPESGLWPRDARGQADVVRWLSWEAAHWSPACTPIIFQRVVKKLAGLGEADEAEVARAETELHRFAEVLNGHLRGRQWLLGNTLTVADFSVASPLSLAAAARLPLEKYPEIRAWYARVGALPAWQKSLLAPMS